MDGSMSPRYQFALKGRRHLPEPYHFTASGLPNVYLLSGVKIERDAGYGELVTIDHLPDLIMAIAFRLVSKPERLTGTEMRFLRKRMGVTQADLAKELWVNEQTVANYEKGKTEPGPADRALRLLFLAHVVDDDAVADELRLEAETRMRPSQRDRRAPRTGPWLVAA
jgi:DNA-binding transcriptional regulator YiaG